MPGASRSTPVVPTPPWARAIASTARAMPAAARPASRRISIGVVPACAAWPLNVEPVPLHPGGAAHGGHGHALAVEHRSLLDVELEVGAQALTPPGGRAHRAQVHAVLAHHGGDVAAVGVGQAGQRPGIERPGHGRAAEEAAPEAGALLVGEVHQGHPVRRPLLGGRAKHLDGGHHAERAVEPAAGGHGVDVRADGNAPLALARQPGPEVGRLVALHRHAVDRGQTGAKELAGLLPLRGPAHSPRPAGAAGQPVQLPEVRDDAPGVERHQPTRSRRIACIRQCAPPPPSVKADSSGS